MKTAFALFVASALLVAVAQHEAFARDDDVIRRGAISALSGSSVTVGGLTCALDNWTEYENLQGQRVSKSYFSVGDLVKLKCRGSAAHSLEMENDIGGGGKGSDDSNINPRKGNSSGKDKRIRARLLPPEDLVTGTVGNLDFRLKRNGSKRDDRLKITVKVPLSSELPRAADQSEAQLLDFRAVFYRGGIAYAACSLVYDVSAAIKNPSLAQYKVDLRLSGKKSKPKLKASKGVCSINLDTEFEQPGLPVLRKGDSVNIEEAQIGEFLGVIIR